MAMAMAIHFTKDRFTSFFTKQKPTKALGRQTKKKTKLKRSYTGPERGVEPGQARAVAK